MGRWKCHRFGFLMNVSTNPTSGIFPWAQNGGFGAEPNDLGHEDCVMIWDKYNYKWNDEECDGEFLQYPICNYPDSNGDKYSLYYADNIYMNQSKIRGITSWGLWTNNNDSFHNAIGNFSWITEQRSLE